MQTATNDERWKTWTRGASPWGGPLLAQVAERSGYPYDYMIRLSRLGISATESSIYRGLERFERIGLASSRTGSSGRSGQRVRMYEATARTQAAVEEWMLSPLPELPLRGPLAARIALSSSAHADGLLMVLDQYEKSCFELLKRHKDKHPTQTWRGMEKEATRQGLTLRVKAELQWMNVVRGYIDDFRTDRDVGLTILPSAAGDSWKTWDKGFSPLNGPLLALLNTQPGHPNDFLDRLLEGLGPTWEASLTTIGRILKRFERIDLASSREADSEKTGQKVRVYSATDLTPLAVLQWMQSSLPELPLRGPLAVRIALSRCSHAPYLLEVLDAYEKTCWGLLEAHDDRQAVATWNDMAVEVARQGISLQIGAELEWIAVVRGYIASFPGVRDVSAVV